MNTDLLNSMDRCGQCFLSSRNSPSCTLSILNLRHWFINLASQLCNPARIFWPPPQFIGRMFPSSHTYLVSQSYPVTQPIQVLIIDIRYSIPDTNMSRICVVIQTVLDTIPNVNCHSIHVQPSLLHRIRSKPLPFLTYAQKQTKAGTNSQCCP